MYIFSQIHLLKPYSSVWCHSKVWVFGAFGKSLGHEGEALMNGISAIRETLERWFFFLPLVMWGHSKKVPVCKLGRWFSLGPKSAGTLILDFLASTTMRNTFLLFKLLSLMQFLTLWIKMLWTSSCRPFQKLMGECLRMGLLGFQCIFCCIRNC